MRKKSVFLVLLLVATAVFIFGTGTLDVIKISDENLDSPTKTADDTTVRNIDESIAESYGIDDINRSIVGDISPAFETPNEDEMPSLKGESAIRFSDAGYDILHLDSEGRVSLLRKLVASYDFVTDTVAKFSGTGDGLSGDFSEIEELINEKGKEVSFLAVRVRDGAAVGYNVDKYFQSCSTIKVPITYWIARDIAEGKRSYKDTVTYDKSDYITGSGVIKDSEIGTVYSLKTLVDYAITESDNIAYQMLCSEIGIKNVYSEFETEYNMRISDKDKSDYRYWLDSSARLAFSWWLDVYEFKDSCSVGKWYWNLFGDAKSRISTALRHQKECYTKTGSSNYCVHETGYVEGDEPYFVFIFTRSDTAGESNEYYFYNLAEAIDKLICS